MRLRTLLTLLLGLSTFVEAFAAYSVVQRSGMVPPTGSLCAGFNQPACSPGPCNYTTCSVRSRNLCPSGSPNCIYTTLPSVPLRLVIADYCLNQPLTVESLRTTAFHYGEVTLPTGQTVRVWTIDLMSLPYSEVRLNYPACQNNFVPGAGPTTTTTIPSGPTTTTTITLPSGPTTTVTSTTTTLPTIPVNGVCGTSNGGQFASMPSSNLCAAGTVNGPNSTSVGWEWTCNGVAGGSNSSPCRAASTIAIPGQINCYSGAAMNCQIDGGIADPPCCTICGNYGAVNEIRCRWVPGQGWDLEFECPDPFAVTQPVCR